MNDGFWTCDSCNGAAFGIAPWPCPPCKGTGKKLCVFCREKPADQVIEGDNLACADCAILQSGCAYCVSGDPVRFYDSKPCCAKCDDAFRESGRLPRDTERCVSPDFEAA